MSLLTGEWAKMSVNTFFNHENSFLKRKKFTQALACNKVNFISTVEKGTLHVTYTVKNEKLDKNILYTFIDPIWRTIEYFAIKLSSKNLAFSVHIGCKIIKANPEMIKKCHIVS